MSSNRFIFIYTTLFNSHNLFLKYTYRSAVISHCYAFTTPIGYIISGIDGYFDRDISTISSGAQSSLFTSVSVTCFDRSVVYFRDFQRLNSTRYVNCEGEQRFSTFAGRKIAKAIFKEPIHERNG